MLTSGLISSRLKDLIDSYDDESLSEYTAASGSTAAMAFDTATAVNGASLYLDGSNSTAYQEHYTTNPPGGNLAQQGDRIIYYWRSNNVTDDLYAGVYNDHSAGYWSRIRTGTTGDATIQMHAGATTETAAFTESPDTWYRAVIEWDDGATFGGAAGDMTATVEDMSGTEIARTLTINDTASASADRHAHFYSLGATTHRLYLDEVEITNR